jgi:tRNA (guanine9-N1)-methyltransferase
MEATPSSNAPEVADINPLETSETPSPVVEGEAPVKIRLSKAEKRAIAEEKRKEFWKAKRVVEKETKKRKRQELRAQILEAGGNPREELKTGKDNAAYKLKRRKVHEMDFSAQKIVIDLGFDSEMTEKDIRSLASQLTHLYGKNRIAEHPLQLHLTDFGGQCESHMRSLNGFENWKGVTVDPKAYIDIFPKDKLVYLSAESDVEVTELNEDDIYIIGGLVDHNRLKGVCHQKAVDQGIRTARLPIDSFMELKTRKVLTVNQVFEILLNWTIYRDWSKAFSDLIPKRKGGQLLGTAATSDSQASSSAAAATEDHSGENPISDSSSAPMPPNDEDTVPL